MTEKVVYAIQDEYPDDFAWCYGCGRMNEQGHQFRTGWQEDKTITKYKPMPEHTAIPGFVYGGLIASLIDCHGTGSASLALHRGRDRTPTICNWVFTCGFYETNTTGSFIRGCRNNRKGTFKEMEGTH